MDNQKNQFIENTLFLSCLAYYNSERRSTIERYYLELIKSGEIFNKRTSIRDIAEFAKNLLSNSEKINMDAQLEEQFKFLTFIDNSQKIAGTYMVLRYSNFEIMDRIKQDFGFTPLNLFETEHVIYSFIISELNETESENCYQFQSKEEYADLSFIADPSNNFKEKWNRVIIFLPEEGSELVFRALSTQFLKEIGLKPEKIDNPLVSSIRKSLMAEVNESIKSISISYEDIIADYSNINDLQFIFTPLIKIDDSTILIPFPYHLSVSTPIRVEKLISQNIELMDYMDKHKGKIVEKIVPLIFQKFGAINLISNAVYSANNATYESDGIITFSNSIWAIEVKTHPILRNLWKSSLSKIKQEYSTKIIEGYAQGVRALNYIEDTANLKKFISSNSDINSEGVIVIVDGFIPTLFYQNKKVDSIFGITDIYSEIEKNTFKLAVFNIMDLLALSYQPESIQFEKFLRWRVKDQGRTPLITSNEREQWAYYFDNYVVSKDLRIAYEKLIENENTLWYSSKRFNDKTYLSKLVKKENDG